MSRIHEALKKAELQDGTSAAPVPEIRPPERPLAVPTKKENFVKLPESSPAPSPNASAATPSLRFEDIREGCSHVTWRPDPIQDVFSNPVEGGHAVEQFRTLRSRLYQLRAERPMRAVLVTSPIAADGKTFITSNLAQAIVRQPDRRVLLIDADLRSSRLHTSLGAPLGPGLTDYLRGAADEMAVIQHGQESGLYLIAGGKPVSNASELLSNGRLKVLIERLGPCFDWILIDSAPYLPVADASIIASFCDGILLVVRAGATPSSAARKACQELQKRNLSGIVLNAVDEKTLTYGSYYGRAPYGDADATTV